MNYDVFEKKLISALCNSITSGLRGKSFITEMYLVFTEESRKYTDELRLKNETLIQTFEDIAQMYGFEYQQKYTLESIEQRGMELKNKIASLAVSEKPKQRYLCYSWGDDCGHSYCEVVTEKNIEGVNSLLSNDLETYEYLYQEDSALLLAMSARKSKSVECLMDLREDALIDEIKLFFKEIIIDDSVPLQEFSEYFECLISDSRHSGSATSWGLL